MSRQGATLIRSLALGTGFLLATAPAPANPVEITGQVRYYVGDRPVPGAALRLTGSTTASAATDNGGNYALFNVDGNNAVLTPSKLGDFDSGIAALDAAFILQAAVGLRTLDARQRLACDVSGDGTVSAFDAALIMQRLVGLIDTFPVSAACGSDWLFLPDAQPVAGQHVTQPVIAGRTCQPGQIAYDSLATSASHQDFVAILFGDCTGNWQFEPSPTPTNSGTPTPTATPTRTASPSASPSATSTPSRSPTITSTPTASPTVTPRPLGTIALLSGPTACGGQSCSVVQSSCLSLAQTASATLKVGAPTAQPERGTIVFATGFTGTTLWETRSADAARILGELRAAGFRTVQVQWTVNWYFGARGQLEGEARLACNPASVFRWIYDNLHTIGPDKAFCAEGHSNGASQVAYALTQYGLSDILADVVLESGPNFARLDVGCLRENPSLQALWYSQNNRNNVDWGFGYPNDGSGPCGRRDTTFRAAFQQASVAFGNWPFVYPRTMVHFLFGGDDITATAGHGKYYHDVLVQAGSPLVREDIEPNTPHDTVGTPQGANMIRDAFLNECIPR